MQYLYFGVDVDAIGLSTHDYVIRYRYRGFRLLVHGDDGLFLVPTRWSRASSTLMVPLDESVRVQFRFVDLPPNGAE